MSREDSFTFWGRITRRLWPAWEPDPPKEPEKPIALPMPTRPPYKTHAEGMAELRATRKFHDDRRAAMTPEDALRARDEAYERYENAGRAVYESDGWGSLAAMQQEGFALDDWIRAEKFLQEVAPKGYPHPRVKWRGEPWTGRALG